MVVQATQTLIFLSALVLCGSFFAQSMEGTLVYAWNECGNVMCIGTKVKMKGWIKSSCQFHTGGNSVVLSGNRLSFLCLSICHTRTGTHTHTHTQRKEGSGTEKWTEKERNRERETEEPRARDRQTDRKTDRQKDRETHTHLLESSKTVCIWIARFSSVGRMLNSIGAGIGICKYSLIFHLQICFLKILT